MSAPRSQERTGLSPAPQTAPPWETPLNASELRSLLHTHFDLSFPALSADNPGPMNYLAHAFFEGGESWDHARIGAPSPEAPTGPFDCLVWANRGGGKTFLGAVATMLDLVFKPGIEIRILGGSLDQSQRMHTHLRRFFERDDLAPMVNGRITDRRLRLHNGSEVELLAQSQASVRGTRIQKLRCDEVELFKSAVWDAAQLTTRARDVEVPGIGTVRLRAWVECLSTMHLVHGMMHRLVEEAREGKRRLFKWGVVDVLERCDDRRRCKASDPGENAQTANEHTANQEAASDASATTPNLPCAPLPFAISSDCPLLPDCAGRAKSETHAGHMPIDDAIAMKSRVSQSVWEAEMLCLRPSRSSAVLPEFDAKLHVVDALPRRPEEMDWVGGMDFGTSASTVILWGALDQNGVLWIADEYNVKGMLLEDHVRALQSATWPRPRWIAADRAGNAANGQTGFSDILVLQRAGFNMVWHSSRIFSGINLLRARLRPAFSAGGSPRLFVLSRCRTLIESLEKYHYDDRKPDTAEPVKDGWDHAVDALRYLVVHLGERFTAAHGRYA